MPLRDLLRLAAANLGRNRSRSLLTLVGVAVGVAALVTLLSYGAGLQKLAEDEVEALDLYNALRLTSAPDPIASFADVRARDTGAIDPRRADGSRLTPITDSLLARIEALPGVLAAYPEVGFPVRLQRGSREVFAGAEAIPPAFERLAAYRPPAGAFFATPADSAILLPATMAERLGFAPAEAAVGETLTLVTASLDLAAMQRAAFGFSTGARQLPLRNHDVPVTVAGLLPSENTALSGFVRIALPQAFADSLPKVTFFSTLDLIARGPETGGYAAARVQLTDEAAFEPVRQAIEAEGLFVAGFRERFSQFQRLFIILDGSLLLLGLIALGIAVIGISNTMAMNVMERRGEIGVMKAVGGEEGTVLWLFIAESLLLGAVGAAVGVVGGWLTTLGLNALVNALLRRVGIGAVDVFYLAPLTLVGIVLGTLAVSVLAGLIPARRAARLDPVEALRAG